MGSNRPSEDPQFQALVDNAGKVGDAARWWLEHIVGPGVRTLHRPRIRGLEHLPRDRPFLLVSHHPSGLGLATFASFFVLYTASDMPRLAGFVLPQGFDFSFTASVHRELGSVPSTYEYAYAVLERGGSLFVFPGGDHEGLQPVWRAPQVDFAGRKGFLRIARTAGVPIVPLGIRGAHFTAPVLWRSTWLPTLLVTPRLLGFKRWAITLLGLIGVLVLVWLPGSWWWRGPLIWLWLAMPFVYLPMLPVTLRFEIGEPLEPAHLFDADADEAADLSKAYATVIERVQACVSGAGKGASSTRHG